MATKLDLADPEQRAPRRGFAADQDYFTRFTIALALLILLGFAQFSLRGFVDVQSAPLLTHLHGILMVVWLGVAVAQNVLVQRVTLSLHRTLGRVAVVLVPVVALLGVAVGFSALVGNRAPPFFSNAYFLALTTLEPLVFAGLVLWGASLRRKVEWHRRAMLGALVVILEPALGRLLPMPLMGGWGEWVILVVQLLVLSLLARHDRKVLGRAHPVTLILMAVVAATHVAVAALAAFPPFATFAEGLG